MTVVYLNKENTKLLYLYRIVLMFLLPGLIAIPLAGDAFGHGIGSDQAPPISFGGMDVTVLTQLTPSDITVGEIDDANMSIRFFDTLTDANLNEVTYRIEVYRNEALLANNLFYDTDGELNVEIRPIFTCGEVQLWRCTDYFGEVHPIAGGLFARGQGLPVIQGPIFDKGGLYNIQVTIEGAASPKTLVAEPLEFETFVSVAQEQDFVIRTAHAEEVPIVVKTYYDDITSFDYSDDNDMIKFEMPFDWAPDYISQVQVVHEEIRIPKSFAPYAAGTNFKGYVNGIEVNNRILLLDPYSYDDQNIIHFLVTGSELQRINGILGAPNHDVDKMTFEIIPQSDVVSNTAEFYLVNPATNDAVGSTVNVSWDSSYVAGDNIPFEFTFFDESGGLLKDVKYAYYVVGAGDNIIKSVGDDPDDLGIEALEGIDIQEIVIPTRDTHRIDVWLLGQGPGLDPAYAGVGSALIEVGPSPGMADGAKPPAGQQVVIPPWVKNNAGLWSAGQIDDATFVSGIQYLIREGVIVVPSTDSEARAQAEIPSWVKSNAKIWSEGLIDDQTFASGLQWMIANGIIVL